MAARRKLESEIQGEAIAKALAIYGVEARKLEHAIGDPDTLFLVPGHPLLVEFKRPGEQPRINQLITHTRWRGAGYDVQVHTSVDGALWAVRAALATPLWGPAKAPAAGDLSIEDLRARVHRATAALLAPKPGRPRKTQHGSKEDY